MTGDTLVDAGPLVAILSRDDSDHARCVDALKRLRAPLLTTWPPLTEAMYLLGFSAEAQSALLQLVERGAVRVLPLEPDDLPPVRKIMARYRDARADFADATLIHVAEREKLRRIFTLDRRDFSIYRVGRGRGRALQIVPGA